MRKDAKILGMTVPRWMGYLVLIAIPFFAAYVSIEVWKLLLPFLPEISKDDNLIILAIAGFFAGIYIFLVGRVLDTVWRQCEEIKYAHYERSIKTFIYKKDTRIPAVMHILLGGIAFLVMLLILVLSYDKFIIGEFVVGIWAFGVTICFEVANELDNPLSGVWRIKLDEEFLKMVEDYIRENGNTKKVPN